MNELDAETIPARRFSKRWFFAAVFMLLLVLLAIVWWQRFRIADDLVRDQLNETGVRASYTIDEIGLRTQRLKNVVLGDPANPDLTAREVEVDVALGFGIPEIRAVRADGVRLRGRFADGKLSFGELDKFRDTDSKEAFSLPNLKVLIEDTILSLSTPWGGIGASLAGNGNLRNSFDGQLLVRSPTLNAEGCAAQAIGFKGALRTRSGRLELDGPLSAALLNCAKQRVSLAGVKLSSKVKLSAQFDTWEGDVGFAASNARLAGQQVNMPQGKVSFFGTKARTDFDLSLAKAGYRGASLAIKQLSGGAKGSLSFGDSGLSASATGNAQMAGGSVDPSVLAGLSGIAKGTRATPVGPLTASLTPALQKAARAFDGQFNYEFSLPPDRPSRLLVDGLKLSTASGAHIVQSGQVSMAGGGLNGPLSLAMSGGGLPAADLALRQQGSGWAGTLALKPYVRGNASLSLPKLAFTSSAAGVWRFNGQALLSGPLMGGRVEGLSLPVDGSYAGGTFSMLSGCRQVRFSRFQTGSLSLPAQSLQACAQGGSILQAGRGGTRFALTAPSLSGRGQLGGTPLAYSGANVRFDLDSGFAANNVSVDLGRPDALTQFTMARLDGRFAGGGLNGTLEGGAGQIGNVPLLIEEANGNWSWTDSILALDGMARVSDAEQVDRFRTLAVPSMQVALENSVITAIGQLAEPKSGITIADVDIRHELNSSTGRALLAVESLRFGDRLQPSDLTPLTVGAIANVEGSISGDGVIEWDGNGVKSRGKFSTDALDFAAAFGPVTGLSTEVNFTDLLGMETAPSQVAKLAVVNPGVPAFDGKLEYRLLPDQKVQIEGGRWPFYGGELILEPTVLDFDVQAKRELTFRMVGLDAEKFLAGYELENIRVAGVFDGTLPMVFDAEGGRIVGGWLVSRPGGGEVSYLGPLAYEDMGAMANFAFEALRSIAFDEMQIGVNGNIGGEVVTEVRFRGLQQGSGAKRNFITRQLAKLPIQFNVRIQSEFISLFGDMRLLFDGAYAAQRLKSELNPPAVVTGEEQTPP